MKKLEQCPKCKNWTLFYDPQSEHKICYNCNNKIEVKYCEYIREKNIADSLRYPSILVEGIVKKQ
jgi:acetyl-CoA carboxylase beta subunit